MVDIGFSKEYLIANSLIMSDVMSDENSRICFIESIEQNFRFLPNEPVQIIYFEIASIKFHGRKDPKTFYIDVEIQKCGTDMTLRKHSSEIFTFKKKMEIKTGYGLTILKNITEISVKYFENAEKVDNAICCAETKIDVESNLFIGGPDTKEPSMITFNMDSPLSVILEPKKKHKKDKKIEMFFKIYLIDSSFYGFAPENIKEATLEDMGLIHKFNVNSYANEAIYRDYM